MLQRDKIFYTACCLTVAGVVLAVMGYEVSILFFIMAYLLRPVLHELGFAHQYTDERQLAIHARSGNLAFIAVMLVAVGLALWRITGGERPEELYILIAVGFVVRSLTGLVLVGDYRKAGVTIISAVGIFLTLFILLEGGFSLVSVVGGIVGMGVVALGQAARKAPKAIAVLILVCTVGVIFFFHLYDFQRITMSMWLFFVFPMLSASVCLLLGSGDEEKVVASRVRMVAFGALASCAGLVFALLIIFGSERGHTSTYSTSVPEEKHTEIEGIACTNRITYYENGTLRSCTLAREDTISNQPLPAGTVIYMTSEGTLDWCFLPHDTYIQGHLCRGGGHDFMTCFHPNGQLRVAWLAEDEYIQGIPCEQFHLLPALVGKDYAVRFYDNGQLQSCVLSEGITKAGRSLKKGERVQFDRKGKILVTEDT